MSSSESDAGTDPDNHRDSDACGQAFSPVIERGIFPADLVNVAQWLTWKPTDVGRKVPRAPYVHPDWPDKFVSAQDPKVWTGFETAEMWAEKLPNYDVAFNIRDRDEHQGEKFVLVDYDKVRNPDTKEIHPVVRKHLNRAGSYADVSTSGTGVHIFCRGTLPDGVKAIDADLPEVEDFPNAEIEVYDSGRYSAMTGHHIVGTPKETTNAQAFLDGLADEFATVAEGTPDEFVRQPEKSRKDRRRLDDLEELEEDDQDLVPGLCLFMLPTPDSPRLAALRAATKADWEARRELGRAGPLLVAAPDAQLEFLGRLSHALYDLHVETGIYVPVSTFLQHIHGRTEGDIAGGEEGVVEHFEQDISVDDVARVWSETVRSASAGPPSMGAYERGQEIKR